MLLQKECWHQWFYWYSFAVLKKKIVFFPWNSVAFITAKLYSFSDFWQLVHWHIQVNNKENLSSVAFLASVRENSWFTSHMASNAKHASMSWCHEYSRLQWWYKTILKCIQCMIWFYLLLQVFSTYGITTVDSTSFRNLYIPLQKQRWHEFPLFLQVFVTYGIATQGTRRSWNVSPGNFSLASCLLSWDPLVLESLH